MTNACEVPNCRNRMRYAVSYIKTTDNAVGVCGLHLQWAFGKLNAPHPLFLVGKVK